MTTLTTERLTHLNRLRDFLLAPIHDRQEFSDAATELSRLIEAEKELDIQRVRLAACGVIAMANTRESAALVRVMHPQYFCASIKDVMDAVDREIALRYELAAIKADTARLNWLFDNPIEALDVIGRHRRGEERFIRTTIDERIEAQQEQQT